MVEFDFCRLPEQQMFFVLSDGTMAVCLYDSSEEIVGWYRLLHGSAQYESVITISTESGDYVYAVMASEDGTARWVERFDEDLMIQKAELVTFVGGVGTTSSRLFSEDVQIQEVGKASTGEEGAVSFTGLSGDHAVGIGFASRFESLSLSPGAEFGPGLMKEKSIIEVFMLIHTGKNFKVGVVSDSDDDMIFVEEYCEKQPIRGGFEVDAGLKIIRDLPFPLEITALMPEVEVNEK